MIEGTMIKCVKTIGDRRHLLIAKIECGRIFPVTKEKIGQYHKSKQTITMEKVRETCEAPRCKFRIHGFYY